MDGASQDGYSERNSKILEFSGPSSSVHARLDSLADSNRSAISKQPCCSRIHPNRDICLIHEFDHCEATSKTSRSTSYAHSIPSSCRRRIAWR